MVSLSFINPEPITKKGIQEYNREIQCIYKSKKGRDIKFEPRGKKTAGSSVGTIYARVHADSSSTKPCSTSIGKIKLARGELNDPNTIRTLTRKKMYMAIFLERMGYDLYYGSVVASF